MQYLRASFSEEKQIKIRHRRWYVRKQKASDPCNTSKGDDLDLLGDDVETFSGSQADLEGAADNLFYCVNTSYPMDNLLNWSAQTGPPNVRKRCPVFPPAGRSVVLCTPQMAPCTCFLSRQPDVIASFSFGMCTVQTCFQHLQIF